MSVEAISRPAPQGPTAIPAGLAAYLEDQGYRWSWQPIDPRLQSVLYHHGMEPLDPMLVKEKDEDLYDAVFEGQPGTRRLFVHEGKIIHQDCCLMIQRQELWEQMEAEQRERLALLEKSGSDGASSPEEIAKAMQTLGFQASAVEGDRAVESILADLEKMGAAGPDL